jgi:hypothetical protein
MDVARLTGDRRLKADAAGCGLPITGRSACCAAAMPAPTIPMAAAIPNARMTLLPVVPTTARERRIKMYLVCTIAACP